MQKLIKAAIEDAFDQRQVFAMTKLETGVAYYFYDMPLTETKLNHLTTELKNRFFDLRIERDASGYVKIYISDEHSSKCCFLSLRSFYVDDMTTDIYNILVSGDVESIKEL